MSDWSLLAPDLLFLQILSHVDSNTFFHQLPRVSKRWAAAQSDDRWFDIGSRWIGSIAARLRLSASQSRAWQHESMDTDRMRQQMQGWQYDPAMPRSGRDEAEEEEEKTALPTADKLRETCSLLWRALRSLQWQLMVDQGVGVRQVDGERRMYYDVPLALHQYAIDWLTVRQLPICFTAGEATEKAEERFNKRRRVFIPRGLIWEGSEWWTASEELDDLGGFWDEVRYNRFIQTSDDEDSGKQQQEGEKQAEVKEEVEEAKQEDEVGSSLNDNGDHQKESAQAAEEGGGGGGRKYGRGAGR